MMNLWQLMQQPVGSVEAEGRIYGVVVGVVTNNKDDEGLCRVKVKFPWLVDDDESYWARLVSPMAGKERGIVFLPEVEDEVLVVFEHGDVNRPYILGALWNGEDKPPETSDGKIIFASYDLAAAIKSYCDDTDGAEKIEIILMLKKIVSALIQVI